MRRLAEAGGLQAFGGSKPVRHTSRARACGGGAARAGQRRAPTWRSPRTPVFQQTCCSTDGQRHPRMNALVVDYSGSSRTATLTRRSRCPEAKLPMRTRPSMIDRNPPSPTTTEGRTHPGARTPTRTSDGAYPNTDDAYPDTDAAYPNAMMPIRTPAGLPGHDRAVRDGRDSPPCGRSRMRVQVGVRGVPGNVLPEEGAIRIEPAVDGLMLFTLQGGDARADLTNPSSFAARRGGLDEGARGRIRRWTTTVRPSTWDEPATRAAVAAERKPPCPAAAAGLGRDLGRRPPWAYYLRERRRRERERERARRCGDRGQMTSAAAPKPLHPIVVSRSRWLRGYRDRHLRPLRPPTGAAGRPMAFPDAPRVGEQRPQDVRLNGQGLRLPVLVRAHVRDGARAGQRLSRSGPETAASSGVRPTPAAEARHDGARRRGYRPHVGRHRGPRARVDGRFVRRGSFLPVSTAGAAPAAPALEARGPAVVPVDVRCLAGAGLGRRRDAANRPASHSPAPRPAMVGGAARRAVLLGVRAPFGRWSEVGVPASEARGAHDARTSSSPTMHRRRLRLGRSSLLKRPVKTLPFLCASGRHCVRRRKRAGTAGLARRTAPPGGRGSQSGRLASPRDSMTTRRRPSEGGCRRNRRRCRVAPSLGSPPLGVPFAGAGPRCAQKSSAARAWSCWGGTRSRGGASARGRGDGQNARTRTRRATATGCAAFRGGVTPARRPGWRHRRHPSARGSGAVRARLRAELHEPADGSVGCKADAARAVGRDRRTARRRRAAARQPAGAMARTGRRRRPS